jgi:hypothetical protein
LQETSTVPNGVSAASNPSRNTFLGDTRARTHHPL